MIINKGKVNKMGEDIEKQFQIRMEIKEMYNVRYGLSRKERKRKQATFSLTINELVDMHRSIFNNKNSEYFDESLIRLAIQKWFTENG